jgi:flagellar protein FlaG
MNLQFSLSTNTMSSNTSEIRQPIDNASSNQDTSTVTTVKSGTELARMERQGAQVTLGEEHLIRTIERAVKALQGPSTTLEVSVHQKTHAIMVKVLNKDTGELIREIPAEKTLDLVANMMEIAGILIDEKV